MGKSIWSILIQTKEDVRSVRELKELYNFFVQMNSKYEEVGEKFEEREWIVYYRNKYWYNLVNCGGGEYTTDWIKKNKPEKMVIWYPFNKPKGFFNKELNKEDINKLLEELPEELPKELPETDLYKQRYFNNFKKYFDKYTNEELMNIIQKNKNHEDYDLIMKHLIDYILTYKTDNEKLNEQLIYYYFKNNKCYEFQELWKNTLSKKFEFVNYETLHTRKVYTESNRQDYLKRLEYLNYNNPLKLLKKIE